MIPHQAFKVEEESVLFGTYWKRTGNADPVARETAYAAFSAAFSISRNYIGDAEVYPEVVVFANGRCVTVGYDNGEPCLFVKMVQARAIISEQNND